MSALLFSKSALLGVAIAAPVGPIGALCINRTLQRGFLAGVAGGLGTAIADACYSALAAVGFATFAATFALVSTPLAIGGGLFLLWLGWKSIRTMPEGQAAPAAAGDLAKTTFTTFLLTMSNPMTILSFAALFVALGLAKPADPGDVATVVIGVFIGSMAWWVALSGGVVAARRKLPDSFAAWIGRGSGLLIIGFGLASIGSAVMAG